MPHIDLGNMTVPISNAAKNIGVLFDDTLTMKNHVQHNGQFSRNVGKQVLVSAPINIVFIMMHMKCMCAY